MPRTNFGVLTRNAVYVRRNTENVEADGEDLARLFAFGKRGWAINLVSYQAAWEQLYRDCEGFDPRRIFIAVIDREVGFGYRDWGAMAGVSWNLIVDFDADTDINGNYFSALPTFRERRALRLSALDEFVSITNRSTLWVAANGLNSRPTTVPSTNWRDWNRSKATQLEGIVRELAKITEPAPVTLVVFGGESTHVAAVCAMADKEFTDRIGYVIANDNYVAYDGVAEQFDATTVAIPFQAVCEGMRALTKDAEPPSEVAFPQMHGGTVALSSDRARWVEEHLQPACSHYGALQDGTREDSAFLKGATVSWDDLAYGLDARRDITSQLELQIHKELNDRATRRLNFWHRPGAGATTVARRIAWNLQHQFPAVIALEIQPQETAERVRHLFGMTRLPILIVIDLPHVYQESIDRFYEELRQSHTPAVLFNVQRRFENRPGNEPNYLDAILTNPEAVALAEVFSRQVPNLRLRFEALVQEPDRSKRSPFYFGLTAFGRDFTGLESYVEARLSNVSDPVRKCALVLAFAHYYGQVSLSLQTFASLFNVAPSKLVTPSSVFPEPIRELLVEEDTGVRPAHYLIGEEILQQQLGVAIGERRNWRIGLADLAIEFIDLLANVPHRSRGPIHDILRATFIERGRNPSPAGLWDDDFSRVLTDIQSVEGQRRVLSHLIQKFPDEPHFWAHLGRFYSRVSHDHQRAHEAHQAAIDLMRDDSRLHHMAGMGWRAELYDELSAPDPDLGGEYEANLFHLIDKAAHEFDEARWLDKRNDYNYISHVQMIQRVVGSISNLKGYRHNPVEFLVLPSNAKYRELVDGAQNLLSDLALIKGDESPSQLQVRLTADLESLYGDRTRAIERLTNLLDRLDAFKPPIRRAIIRNYVARNDGKWEGIPERQLSRIVELASSNIKEEPESDYNLRLWLRAIRTENAISVDRVAEQLAYKILQKPSVDTKYYLYITKFLQLEAGDFAAASVIPPLIYECRQMASDLSRTTSSFEWLGKGAGWGSLIHLSTLGRWDNDAGFWENSKSLKRLRGRIATIRHQGSGEIELPSGLRAFFTPSRGEVPGGYVAGQDIGREVEFFLGFSYDGLRAWSVGEPT